MVKTPMIRIIATLCLIAQTIMGSGIARSDQPLFPVIFIHGIGSNSSDWKETGPAVSQKLAPYYATANHPFFKAGSGLLPSRLSRDPSKSVRDACVYVTFEDPSGRPKEWADELAVVIAKTRAEAAAAFPKRYASARDVNVNLIAHSMGGLAARYYLATHLKDHGVARLLMIGTPHQGSATPRFRHLPLAVTAGGIGAFFLSAGNPIFLAVAGAGVAAQAVTRSIFQIKPHSQAAADLELESPFLKQLNAMPLPTNVSYGIVVSRMDIPGMVLFDQFMGYPEGSDGASSLQSQRLSAAGIPNFKELKYREYTISAPHMDEPTAARDAILDFLSLP